MLVQGGYHVPRTVEEVDKECPVAGGEIEILSPAQMEDQDTGRVAVEEKAKIARKE